MVKSENYELEDGFSITFYDLGIGFTKKTDIDAVESLLIFSKDYW